MPAAGRVQGAGLDAEERAARARRASERARTEEQVSSVVGGRWGGNSLAVRPTVSRYAVNSERVGMLRMGSALSHLREETKEEEVVVASNHRRPLAASLRPGLVQDHKCWREAIRFVAVSQEGAGAFLNARSPCGLI